MSETICVLGGTACVYVFQKLETVERHEKERERCKLSTPLLPSKDLKLLLNLLAETSGVPESFRILTLFDKKFQSLWKPQNLRLALK